MQLSMPKGYTTDLVPSTLTTLSSIMLAQAQESFYRKAYAEKMNPSALVKIAAQTGDFYSEASKLMDVSKGYWKKDWLNVISGKAFGFQAIAELHQAQVHWERHEVGERLSRLKHAFELVEKMKRRLQPACLREQISEIENAHKSATSDNRLIYHERIPDYFTLPALPRATLAKPTAVEKHLYPGFKDIFAAVVPETTVVAMKKFEQMKTERLQKLKDRLSEQTELMDGIVASLNVPDVVPDDVKRKSTEVKSTGGVVNMRKKLNELMTSNKRNSDILVDIDRVLVDENRSDADLRHQLRSERIRITSDEVVGPFVQEISKHLGDLKKAAEVDKALHNLFNSNEKAIDILSKEENCLPVEEMVNSSIKKQEYLLCDIENWSTRFSNEGNSQSTSQRQQMLRSLQLGYDAFKEIHRKLDEKIKAYSNQTAALRRLQVKVNDFAFARQTEKEELLRGRQILDSSRQGGKSTQSQALNPVTAPPHPIPTFLQGAAYSNGMTPNTPFPAQPQYAYPQYPYYGAAQPNVQPLYNYNMPPTANIPQNPPYPTVNYPTNPTTSWRPH
ncbi:BRO1 domain-containing protein [Trichostrongylus colubriformis]|uniref:BRO1 domain-containing protein n=1 Tax=Trichostrongylus colubriformis TaxID=6319 RepID=A0AAN8IN49_TRICO